MLSEIFQKPKPVIGVVQLLPLPGSAGWDGQLTQVIARAEQEATALASGGVDGILIENFHDAPYPRDRMDTAGAIAMAQIAHRIQHFTDTPLGISVLQNDPETALAIAMNVGARFIRVPVLVGTLISEAGMIEGKLNEMVAYRQRLQAADHIRIFANVTMNHIIPAPQRQAPWKAPLAYLEQVIQAIRRHNVADALILSDREVSPEDVIELRKTAEMPVLAGDSLTPDQVGAYYLHADGLILADGIKKDPIAGMDSRTTVDLTKVEAALGNLHQKTASK